MVHIMSSSDLYFIVHSFHDVSEFFHAVLIHTSVHAYARNFLRENPVFFRKSKDPSICLVMTIHSSCEYPLSWPLKYLQEKVQTLYNEFFL
jgi:hypothetical protein